MPRRLSRRAEPPLRILTDADAASNGDLELAADIDPASTGDPGVLGVGGEVLGIGGSASNGDPGGNGAGRDARSAMTVRSAPPSRLSTVAVSVVPSRVSRTRARWYRYLVRRLPTAASAGRWVSLRRMYSPRMVLPAGVGNLVKIR
ncbi:hypothetical protein GCM10027610_078520 [Dactylosporangium cerinum]